MSLLSSMFIGEHGAAQKPAGTGTVASVGLTAAVALFAVTGSPVTGSGTINLALNTQSANQIFAGPTTGVAATPTFRTLVSDDIPALDAVKIASGLLSTARLGTGTADSTTFLRGDGAWATPGGAGTVTSVDMTVPSILSVSGGPITASGILAITLSTQSANVLFAGPTTGVAAAPTFRTIVAADLSLTGTPSATTFLRGDMTWATPGGGSPGGSDTQVQYNSVGAFAGSANLTFNGTVLTAYQLGLTTSFTANTGGNIIQASSGGGVLLNLNNNGTSTATPLNISAANAQYAINVNMANAASGYAAISINNTDTSVGATYTNIFSYYGGVTASEQNALMTGSASTSTATGTSIRFTQSSSTTALQTQAELVAAWSTATHASRTSYFAIRTVNAGGSATERLRVEGPGRLVIYATSGTQALEINQASGPSNPYGLAYFNTTSPALNVTIARADASAWQSTLQALSSNSSYHPFVAIAGWATAGVITGIVIENATTSAVSAGVGVKQLFRIKSSSTYSQEAGSVAVAWSDATNATRTSYLYFETVNSAASLAERMRLTGDGTLRVGTASIYFGLKPGASGTTVWTMPIADGASGEVLQTDGAGNLSWAAVGGTGTVTSVALSLPSFITVSGSPVTTAGTLTGTLATQAANTIFTGPTTGAAAAPTFRTLVAADLSVTGTADATTFLRGDMSWATAGTVTSVALSLPSFITVTGSPITSAGTLTGTLATQTANTIFAGPTTGAAAAPTFRALVADDIPVLDAAKITTGTLATARLGSGTANSTTFLRGDQTWATPATTPGGSTTQIQFNDASTLSGDSNLVWNNTSKVMGIGTTVDTNYRLKIVGATYGMSVQGTGNYPAIHAITTTASTGSATGTMYLETQVSSGSATNGHGPAVIFKGETSTTLTQDLGMMSIIWSTATHASRTSRFVMSLVDGGGSLTEVLRVDGPGNLTSWITTASTSSLVEAQRISLATSGTPATGLGVSQVFALESSTTANTDAAFLFARWTDPTHASFQAMFGICVYEGSGLSGSSTAPNFAISGGGTWIQNQKTATTNAVVTAWTRSIDTTGTAAANFGLRDLIQLDSNATPGVPAAAFDTTWIDAVTASATSQWAIYLSDAGALTERYRFLNGGLDIRNSTGRLYINGTQVVTTRQPGWAAATGTKTRSTFDAATVTTPQLGERVGALIDDLMTHGLI